MNSSSISFKINTRMIGLMICVFALLGFVSIQAAGRSVSFLATELLQNNLKEQLDTVSTRYTSLDNMGMAQDADAVAKFQTQIFDKLKTFKYKSTGVLYIVDDTGKVLVRSKTDGVADVSKEKFFQGLKSSSRGKISYTLHGVARTAVFDTFDKWKWIVAVEMEDQEIYAPVHSLAVTFAGICFAALLIIVIILFLGTYWGITKPVNEIIQELLKGAQVTTDTAAQVSSLTQQLSQGATEQAASLAETSSSLDQMTSMTRQNSDNSDRANQLASLARQQAENGTAAMAQIQAAMGDIKDSSQKMFKIIKTIEEIAMQTNLLALNASVEAARAGEHGKSFAVVANEVRNLSKRASVAAKETAVLIETSVKSTKNGSEIILKSGEVLSQITDSAGKVANIIGSISLASKEQADGIKQLTDTVNQIDQVTQQTAASARQSANASEELSNQAEQLKETAITLHRLVNGDKQGEFDI